MKRLFDITFSLFLLILLFPLFLVVSLIIIFTSKGGVFFRGLRVGKDGKKFKIFKFRSMKANSEGKGKWNIGNNDPRITNFGKFIRMLKIDELPQLINVLIGDMSFVGPRPELEFYVNKYTEEEHKILSIRPGITDWASLVNISQFEIFTNSKDPDIAYEKYIRPIKLKLQLEYIKTNSFVGDIEILFWTGIKLFTRTKKLPKKIIKMIDNMHTGEFNEK